MNMATKREICEEKLGEYLKASTLRKGEILNSICEVTGMHRKAVIRKLKRLQMKHPLLGDQRGRPTVYTPDVDAALRDIWDVSNELCGELLHGVIGEYVRILKRDGDWRHSAEATNKLLAIGKRTVRRRCENFEKERGARKGLSSTKPSALKSIIPIFKGPWKDLPPGNGQLDTVAHCGSSLLGDMAFSVNYTDACLYWVILCGQWNKGQEATLESMRRIKRRLPFPWLMGHPDTGSEFVNWLAKDWFEQEKIRLTRSEPGKKNDNMYVEERNGHVVRKYLGYERFDIPQIVPLLNELYEKLEDYLNHFIPVRRTLSKERMGARYIRTYEKDAHTPYARLLAHPALPDEIKRRVRDRHETLNPKKLKQEIDGIIDRIMKLTRETQGRNGSKGRG